MLVVMIIHQTAFGGMLQDVVERQAIVFRPEPLDAIVERHCKYAWEQAPVPSVVKQPSGLGTTVPESGVVTAATALHTP